MTTRTQCDGRPRSWAMIPASASSRAVGTGALENLSVACSASPHMASIHPIGRAVMFSLHRRSSAKLMRLSKMSGINLYKWRPLG